MLLGQLMVGGVSSITSTIKLFPAQFTPLDTVHTTRVRPMGNRLPLGGWHTSVSKPPVQPSRAVAVNVTGAPLGPWQRAMTFDGGTVISMHGSLPQPPSTMTGKKVTLRLPPASTATHVTMFEPIGNTLPLGGVQVTVGSGSQLSVAPALNSTMAPRGPSHGTMIRRGPAGRGGVISRTVT